MARIFNRRCRVTVAGLAVEGLRVGFTVQRDLTKRPNHAEIVIYNLKRSTRDQLRSGGRMPVVIEAGYAETDLIILFSGHMREAFSRQERDGTWATILRAGDGDKGLRGGRKTTGTRPGVAIDRVIKDVFSKLQVGAGNLWQAIRDGKSVGDVLAKGFAGAGSAVDQMDALMQMQGLEWSVQDGEMQVLKAGEVLATEATVLAPDTGLEGSPEIDAKGVLTARARLVPGLSPGYPVQFATGWVLDDERIYDHQLTSVYRVEKTRYVGDTHGPDWNAEITCQDPRRVAAQKAAAARKAVSQAAGATP